MTAPPPDPSAPPTPRLLGQLAVDRGLITVDQLTRATALQSREGGKRNLGDILIDLGWVSAEAVREVAALQADLEAQAQEPPPREMPQLSAGASMAEIMAAALAAGASDIHLHADAPLRFRVDGELLPVGPEPLSVERSAALVGGLLNEARAATLASAGQVDFALTVPGLARFRCNAYRQLRGTDAVLRIVPEEPPTLASLGLPSTLARFVNHHQGLVLITGPSGCGKTSTLAALVNLINEERRHHVISAEEPIEFRHPSKRCIVNQREVGRHSSAFASVLRAALREDPDVIAIGELRDHETIALALTAAETGHLVLGTLHTDSAVRTIDRLIGVYTPAEQDQIRIMLSESLRAVISQRLVRRADGRGRVPAVEVLVVTRAVSNLIREDRTFQIRDSMQTGTAEGMKLLEHALAELVRDGLITRAEAIRHGMPEKISDAVRGG